MGESTHGEIDAFITPAADLIRHTLDNVEYDMPAQLNYTAFNDYFENYDPVSLDRLLVSPRKIFTGVKMISESDSGLYDSSSSHQMDNWHKNLDKETGLPHRGDAYHVKFPSTTDDSSLVAFKTEHERDIQIGREYNFEPLEIGECRVVQEIKAGSNSEIQDGQIIFMKVGPVNLVPFVNEYEKVNAEKHGGSKKPILEGKHGLTERELLRRERSLINAHIQIPCKARVLEDRFGKVPNSLKHAIYIEYDNLLPLVSQYLPDPLHLNTDFIAYLKDNRDLLNQFADQFVLTLPEPRSEFYLQ
jgi:hypothetical protein